jgi:ribosome maturation factor RimP
MSEKYQFVIREAMGLIEPVLEELGYELVELEYLSERGKWILRVYIDKPGGITIDDCAMVSGELGDLIDVKDIISHDYVLEISSPGLNRPLRKDKDFLRALGKKVRLRTSEANEGKRNFVGSLTDFKDGILYLKVDGDMVAIPFRNVKKANVVYEFENP